MDSMQEVEYRNICSEIKEPMHGRKKKQDSGPILLFPGQLIVVTDDASAVTAVESLRNSNGFDDGIGIDLEWDADMSPTAFNPIALLQIASHDVAIVLELLKIGKIPDCVKQLLLDETVPKFAHVRASSRNCPPMRNERLVYFTDVNHGVVISFDKSDSKKLAKFHHLAPKPIIDLNTYAQQLGIQRPGLASLAEKFMGSRLDKSDRMTKWSSPHLKERQFLYAATDAWVTRELYLLLQAQNADSAAATALKKQALVDQRQAALDHRAELQSRREEQLSAPNNEAQEAEK